MNDLKVNGGYPEGMTAADLNIGSVVRVRYKERVAVLVVTARISQHDTPSHSIRFKAFDVVNAKMYPHVVHTQIIEYLGPKLTPELLASIM